MPPALAGFQNYAEQGNAAAQGNLGRMYANGEGVPEDDAEAVRWYRLAAEQGYAAAQLKPRGQVRQRRGCVRGRRNRVRLAQHRCRAGPVER